jgi:hypothetical protein
LTNFSSTEAAFVKKKCKTYIDLSKFHVVAVVTNPIRYISRKELFNDFRSHIERAGANLTVVELALGDRPFCHTVGRPNEVQLRSFQEIWHKEAMINAGIQRLPADWEYVAWVDADIMFTNPDWINETVEQLQHHMVVQMFSHAVDLGPDGDPMQTHTGFMYQYHKNFCQPPQGSGYGGYYLQGKAFWHPGYAWAARREAIDAIGQLPDWAILGSADHHLAMALIGQGHRSLPEGLHPNYYAKMDLLEELCEEHIKHDVGYVPGTIVHYFHGKKKDRQYRERWSILIDNQYDPMTDVRYDSSGLWVLNEKKKRLRDEIRLYFRQRNEDSIDTE